MKTQHNLLAKSLHWGTGLLVIYGYIRNGEVTNALNDPAAMRIEVYFGIAVLIAFAFRWFTMRRLGTTVLSEDTPAWEMKSAKLGHLALYASIVLMVVSGLLIAVAQNISQWATDVMAELHGGAIIFFNMIVIVHIFAALWHWLIKRDHIMESMTGAWVNFWRKTS